MGRKILICEWDIFSQVGGGQTVYQNIIRKSPNDTFYYFGTDAAADRPKNAITVPFRQFYDGIPDNIPQPHAHFFFVYRDAMNIARSVQDALGNISIDVVDTPDYRQNGIFLRNALEAHGIAVGTVALALHGTLSSAFLNGWPWNDDPRRQFAELRMREHLQFRVADARYAISSFYAESLQRYASFHVNMLDPLVVIRDTLPVVSAPEDRPADLLFIGRRERRKGPDLFLDVAWWLPEGAYRRLMFVGGDGSNHQGGGSQDILDGIARRRKLNPEFVPPMDQGALQELTRQKSLVFLPSRVDQFNLIALESLLEGCPTVIGQGVGAARFVRERLPELSWLLVGLGCDRSAAAALGEILQDYDRKRQGVVDAVQRAKLAPDMDSLQRIYEPTDRYDRRARGVLHDLADRFSLNSMAPHPSVLPRPAFSTTASRAAGRLAGEVRLRLRPASNFAGYVRRHGENLLRAPRSTAKAMAKAVVNRGHLKTYKFEGMIAQEVRALRFAREVRYNLLRFPERSSVERTNKLRYLNDIISGRRLGRVLYFRDMIRLERLRGNDLIAATYGLRVIRWLGHDHFHLLGFIQDTLRDHGFVREAEAAQVMYGDPAEAEQASRAFLDDQLERHRISSDRPWEIMDDRRGQRRRRVSVIVSMYNAATKLPTFWAMLQQQSVVRGGEADIVLVDSGSPTDEYAVFKELHARDPLPVVYARSKGRETIQAAWNRGIVLSSGEYLAFLGVDEGVHPDCFSVLADELDRDPSVDWVMADSVVTEVDRNGVFNRDIMKYDRTGYRHDWHYLDCTFLSYVGALYRRNIHDRLGYYDETFRAAGDTEFKNRILPHIKSKYVPRALGVFNNYPEERTTQHPRAEIEDLRAWYLHRTPAGVSYALENRPMQDAVELLKDTLGYRKCFCQHISTDIELADSLATYLARGSNDARYRKVAGNVHEMLQMFRGFERLQPTRKIRFPEFEFSRSYQAIRTLSAEVAGELGRETPPGFDVFHDNRYEQHWWSWSA